MNPRREQLLAALRGTRPQSGPIELAEGLLIKLCVVPVAKKDQIRREAWTAAQQLPSEQRASFMDSELILGILGAALEHEGLSVEDLHANLAAPVLRRLWSEYEALEAFASPRTDQDLDELYQEVRAHVGESRAEAEAYLSRLDNDTLLAFAISSAIQPSS
jgi:hypothetical protein